MDDSIFVRFFGGSPFIRIVDVFIDNISSDFSKKQVQELAGISKAALFRHWNKIEELKLVRTTRIFGKTKFYALDTKSPVVKKLFPLDWALAEAAAPKTKRKIAAMAR
ncbi:MAG: hypothetical protein V1847_04555 [Candidatus Diapherotrites archaeon]